MRLQTQQNPARPARDRASPVKIFKAWRRLQCLLQSTVCRRLAVRFEKVGTEVVVKSAVPWMEKQLQQLEAMHICCNM